MQYRHELVRPEEGLNTKIYVHSVLDVTAHWHHEMELLMVLKGSVEIRRENQHFVMNRDDVLLINRNELHSIKATCEENALLAIQFNPDMLSHFYPELGDAIFDCNSTRQTDQSGFDRLRTHLAKIIWSFSKKKPWFKFAVEQELMALFETLLTCFPFRLAEESRHQLRERELERLTRIVAYVEENFGQRIQLQDLAAQECVTVHHLSRFFKERMGIAFQEYLFDYRLYQAANRITASRDKISDIAFECGFNDPKLFYKKFKAKYQLTPAELRKQRGVAENGAQPASYMTVSEKDLYKPLFKYLQPVKAPRPRAVSDSQGICINPTKISGEIKPVWSEIMTFGCAYEALKPRVQEQMRQVQSELGFKYARFQGIFVEQMQIVVAPGQYNWSCVDELFDFLLSTGLKPFVCLGYTPDLLASGDKTVARWKGNITPPAEMSAWQDLLTQFFRHIIARYGEEQVASWYFEAWNEPDLEGIFWAANQKTYHQHYLATVRAVRAVSPNIKLGGPSVSHMAFSQTDWLNNFVRFCEQEGLEPDFFSCHIYPEEYGSFDSLESSDNVSRRALGPFGCLEMAEMGRHQLAPLNIPELHITEWNISAVWGNKLLDTAYLGSFIVHNAISLYDKVDSLAVWTFSDLFDERGPAIDTFHGGFGLLTREGIPKPGYHALSLLNRLGPELLARNDDYLITSSDQSIQLLMVNYAHFDELYASGDVSALEILDPYSAFNPHPEKHFSFSFDLPPGRYRITRYQLNREHGSAYDHWQALGAPTPLGDEDIAELKRKAWPERSLTTFDHPGGDMPLSARLPEHGVELVTICPLSPEQK